MATKQWVKTPKYFCDRIHQEVLVLEERIYPGDRLPDVGERFRVNQQQCSCWLECNLIGYPCCWSGINPFHNPLEASRVVGILL
jgi:hypothetical protein